MNFRLHRIALLSFLFPLAALDAVPPPVSTHIENPREVGSTRVRVLFWDIYDISLYSPDGTFDFSRPFALRLEYLRDIEGAVIAEKSVEEMRRQGINEVKLADWFVQMKAIFPNVTRGTELIGVFRPGQPTRFYEGGNFIGVVPDSDFGIPFSRIWLGEETRLPDMRADLLGGRDS